MRRIGRLGKIHATKTDLIYMVLLSVAFLRQSSIFPMYYLTSVIIALIFVMIAACKYSIRSREKLIDRQLLDVGRMLLFPWCVFIINNVLIYLRGYGNPVFLKSSFVQIFIAPIIIAGAISYYYLTRKKALKLFLCTLIIHILFIQLVLLFRMGFTNYFSGILSVFKGNSIGNPLEYNSDFALSLGLLVIYYCDKFIKIKDRNNGKALIALVFVFLAGKKISFLAIIVIGAFFILSNHMSYKRKIKLERIISIFAIVLSIAFIGMIMSHFLSL